jgi:hypothetical protein
LYEIEGKDRHSVEISNRFVALENLDTEVNVNRALDIIRENVNISAEESLCYYELKKTKPCFDEGCSELLDQIAVVTGSERNKLGYSEQYET